MATRIVSRAMRTRASVQRLAVRPLFAGAVTLSVSSHPADRPFTITDALQVRILPASSPIALSPSGRWVAYTVEDQSKRRHAHQAPYMLTGAPASADGRDVWLVSTSAGKARNLTNGIGTSWNPVWSPDGRYLAFYSDRGGTNHVWIWDGTTGGVRQLAQIIPRTYWDFEAIRWTPDSRRLVVKGLPPSATVSDAAKEFGYTPRGAGGAAWGPAKARGSTVMVRGAGSSALAADRAGPRPRRSTIDVIGRSRWAGDLAVIDVTTGATTYLVTGMPAVEGYWISPDGKYLAYLIDEGERPGTVQTVYQLVVCPIDSGQPRVLVPDLEQEFGSLSVRWSPDSRVIAYTTSGPDSHGDLWVVTIGGGRPINITAAPHQPLGDALSAMLWDSSGAFIYLTTGLQAGLRPNAASGSVWQVSVRDRVLTEIAHMPGHSIVGVVGDAASERFRFLDRAAGLLVLTQDEATKQTACYKIDLSSGRAALQFERDIGLRLFEGSVRTDIDISRDARTVAFVAEDTANPGDVWLFTDGTLRQLTTTNPQLAHMRLGTAHVIETPNIDGLRVQGVVLLPAQREKGRRYPLVAVTYPGFYMSRHVYRFGVLGSDAALNLQLLAARGYAVLVADAPFQTGTPMLGLLKDVTSLVDRAIELGVADSARLGVMGFSRGGYATLSLVAQTSRFKAAVSYAGIGSLLTAGGSGWGIAALGVPSSQSPDRYCENSPIVYVDRITTPVLLIHGDKDRGVPVLESDELFLALQNAGKDVVYARYAGEYHVLRQPANVADYWNRVTDWFDSHMHNQGDSVR